MMKILKFTASWCGPCKMLATTISNENAKKVDIKEVDIDTNQEKLTQTFGVRGVPTLIALNDGGVELGRNTGMMTVTQFNDWVTKMENL